jgi:hypothetical protein
MGTVLVPHSGLFSYLKQNEAQEPSPCFPSFPMFSSKKQIVLFPYTNLQQFC